VAQITMMFNQMVERRHWMSKDRFVKIMGFTHMLPGSEALQLAIYVGYLKRRRLGRILASAIIAMRFGGIDFLLVLLAAGVEADACSWNSGQELSEGAFAASCDTICGICALIFAKWRASWCSARSPAS
jgi:hypothetical protein